jgi:hypothetical protein
MGYAEIVRGGLVTRINDDGSTTTTPARRCHKCNKDRLNIGGTEHTYADGDWDWWCAECIK